MGSIAARHSPVLEHVERILAIELLVAAQALDLRLAALAVDGDAPEPGIGVREAHTLVRERVAHLDADREPAPDLAAALAIVKAGSLSGLVAN
jgi:histidine ammonia-lyase